VQIRHQITLAKHWMKFEQLNIVLAIKSLIFSYCKIIGITFVNRNSLRLHLKQPFHPKLIHDIQNPRSLKGPFRVIPVEPVVAQHNVFHNLLGSRGRLLGPRVEVHHGEDHHDFNGSLSRLIVLDDSDLMEMSVTNVLFHDAQLSAARGAHERVVFLDLGINGRIHETLVAQRRHIVRCQDIGDDEQRASGTSTELLDREVGVILSDDVLLKEFVAQVTDGGTQQIRHDSGIVHEVLGFIEISRRRTK